MLFRYSLLVQRIRQLLIRIHDRKFRRRTEQFVIGIFDLIDIVIGRVNLLERFDRLPHRLPRLLIKVLTLSLQPACHLRRRQAARELVA